MSLNYVTLTCDLFDGRGSPVNGGTAVFTPSAQLTDTTDHEIITQAPLTAPFKSTHSPVIELLATDNAAPVPSGWAWTVTFTGVPGNPPPFSFFLPYTGGSSQNLSALVPVSGTPPVQAYLPLAGVARVAVAGHSVASGYLNTEGGERWPARLAAALHAEEVTYAVTNAVLAEDVAHGNPGGFPDVLCGLTPRVASGAAYSVRNAAPYLPLAPAVALNYGFNDLSRLTSDVTANITWFAMALTACCCIARAGGWFPDGDASVAYTDDWAQNTGAAEYGWPTNHYTTTPGGTVTVTVPADFPGGEIDLLFPAVFGGTKWSTAVDGGAAQVLDGTGAKYGANATDANLCVQRLTGLSAGTHTIIATAAAIDGDGTVADFQGWLIAAPSPPAVALVNQPAIPGLPWTVGGAAHTPVTASDVAALNTAIAAVAASFSDGNVVLADIAGAFAAAGGNVGHASPGSLYVSDNGHPNAAGHALIAQTALAALRSVPGAATASPMGLVMRQLGGSLEPALGSGWSLASDGTALGWFGKDRAGNCVLRATLKKSSGTPGETIFTLPPGYQPSGEVIIGGTSWASAYSAANPARLAVQASGAVQWLSGDPSVELDVYASWQADGLGS